jgi:hypothetical protein
MEIFNDYALLQCKTVADLDRLLIAKDSQFRIAPHGAGWKLFSQYDTGSGEQPNRKCISNSDGSLIPV